MRPAALALAAIAALAFAAEAGAAPRVTIRPASSPPGRLVTVTGQGFCADAGCSPISIHITGAPVATAVDLSPDGSFIRQVKVPGVTVPGPTGVVVTQALADGTETTVIEPLEILLRLAPVTTKTMTTEPATTATQPRPRETGPDEPTSPPATTDQKRPDTSTPPNAEPAGAPEATPAADVGEGGLSWPWIAGLVAAGLLAAAAAAAAALRAGRR